jgi:hypothetical protein
MLTLAVMSAPALAAGFAGGDGSPASPYQIATAAQLVAVGKDPNLWDKHFVLTRDLDMARVDPNAITPIGNEQAPFLGTFDGGNHTVSNLRMAAESEFTFGLFGCIGEVKKPSAQHEPLPGHIRNLHLKDVNIQTDGGAAGGLAGTLGCGTITNCSVSGYVKGRGIMSGVGGLVGEAQGLVASCTTVVTVWGEYNVGGLIGASNGQSVSDCSSSGHVRGHVQAGGLIGVAVFTPLPIGTHDKKPADLADPGSILRCTSDCSVTGGYTVGGLVGFASWEGRIEDCYACGPVRGIEDVGGLIGDNYDSCIIRCYASGKVMGEKNTGGLIGENTWRSDSPEWVRYPPCQLVVEETHEPESLGGPPVNGPRWRVVFRPAVQGCFWDGQGSGMARALGAGADAQGGVTRLTTAEMRTPARFQDFGWDFETVWVISPDKPYPRLRWEQARCQE